MKHFNMKIYSTLLIFFFTWSLYSQVGIGVEDPHPSAILEVSSSNKGFLGPKVELKNVNDTLTVIKPAEGLLVYNSSVIHTADPETSLQKGYYFWNGLRWEVLGNGIHYDLVENTQNNKFNTLGYEPSGKVSEVPATVTGYPCYNSTSASTCTIYKRTCSQWTEAQGGNGHWYCSFGVNQQNPTGGSSGRNVTWAQAFAFAQRMGGYLATVTTQDEWNWLKSNAGSASSGSSGLLQGFYYPIWLGLNKVTYSGNNLEYTWITGENSSQWGNQSKPFGDWQNTSEPNNSNSTEGCVHTLSSNHSAASKWNDLNCVSNNNYGRRFALILVEFDQ